VVVAALAAEAVAPGEPAVTPRPDADAADVAASRHRHRVVRRARARCPCWTGADSRPAEAVAGPAIITEANATTIVEPGWEARALPGGELALLRVSARRRVRRRSTARAGGARAVQPSLHARRRADGGRAAGDRGVGQHPRAPRLLLRRVRRAGGLVANAPHMPVHLGSMGASVRAVIDAHGHEMAAGDAWMLNDPYAGGTHLPDITVVSPVMGDGGRAEFYVATRAHHADIGGTTPGSMPPTSRHIDEEGALFDGFRLARAGELLETRCAPRSAGGRWPARNPDQNVADLEAQLAANARGIAELAPARAHTAVRRRRRLHAPRAGQCRARGARRHRPPQRWRVPLRHGRRRRDRGARHGGPRPRRATVDFTGTSPQSPTNFNAPLAVCHAAVLYVFRTLVEADIPLNEGCLRPMTDHRARGLPAEPRLPAAVAAGNVETSQCVVDALYGALGVLAAAQGTMNNFTFGDARRQYYETIAGGSGAGPASTARAGVQTHMTNSRLTDPEVLEARYPVSLVSPSRCGTAPVAPAATAAATGSPLHPSSSSP
jgi:5-oxoprolinase (ATP-hydrolysing)